MRRRTWLRRGMSGGLVLGLALLLAGPAEALIVRLTPLRDVLAESSLIVTATVEVIDPDRPAVVLVVDKALKGKAPFQRMPVHLKGDAVAAKGKETPQLLKRLAKGLPVVVFVSPRDKSYLAFVYTNGTWFGLSGAEADGEVRWSFNHCETYLRRTFKGSTEEMVQTVADALSGKRKPPEPNGKEKPGLGPEAGAKKEGALLSIPDGGRLCEAPAHPRTAVIPTVLVGGPLAMLAMLFPTVFGGWRRWLVLLSIAGTNSTLYTLHYYFADSLAGSWWGSPTALWTVMTLLNVVGVWWAWRRYLAGLQAGEAGGVPGKAELMILVLVSLIGLGTLGYCRWAGQPLLAPAWLPLVAFTLAVWLGTLYVGLARLRATPTPSNPQAAPVVATEVVILTGLLLASTALGAVRQPAVVRMGEVETGEGAVLALDEPGAKAPNHLWTFRLPAAGAIDSTPLVAGDRVYVAAAHDSAFSPHGAVYCLDRATGKEVWSFSDGKKMKQVFSSPVLADGKIYIGEGYHQDAVCKVYCLSADKGEKLWEFQTGSHTESTPCVAGGKVYCGAGDDGLYCLSADKGEKLWNFPSFHIDASPTTVGDRVYAGCGIGDVYQATALFSLDRRTGEPAWRVSTDLPVWGQPVVSGEKVYYATGNGRLNESADKPAGAVACVRAEDGENVWTYKLPDGVLGQVTLSRRHVYFGCRDGYLYCLDRATGSLTWRRQVGSPVVSAAALARCEGSGIPAALYVAGSQGQLAALAPASGRVLWQLDLAERAKAPVDIHANPVVEVVRGEGGERRRIYVAATLTSTGRVGELSCFEDELEPVPWE